MTEPKTLRTDLVKSLSPNSQTIPSKHEIEFRRISKNSKNESRIDKQHVHDEAFQICVICSTKADEKFFNIYTTFTGSSRCLLFDFISKTSNVMFERDKLWSNRLCNNCYNLVEVLDSAETKFLNLKNEFLVILNKNTNVATLCKRLTACHTQTEEFPPGKIEFCSINVKDEFDDLSRGPSPLPVSDSDDEPLAKNKEKNKEEAFIPVSISAPIKCEVDIPEQEIKSEVHVCQKCKLEFKTRTLGAVHAFQVHRIDIAKEPEVLCAKGCEPPKSLKESKKRKSKKKSKRKSHTNLNTSDVEDMDVDDKDWTTEDVKPKLRGRCAGKVLKKPIFIKPHDPNEQPDIKPSTRELQRKVSSSYLIIKKVNNVKPIKIRYPDGSDGKKSDITIKGKKDKLTIVGGSSVASVIGGLQSVGLNVECVDKEKKKEPKKMLPCPECTSMFSTQTRLDYHMVKHTGSNSPFICEVCGASYKHKKACDIHVGMHKGISPWKCSSCDKIFPSKGALSRHEAIHTGTPNYQCDLCGKSFIHTSSFKMHKLSHSGVKPHSCSKCGLALMTRSHLKRHQRVHSGEKRHECPTCGKKFSERYNLYAHQKSHDQGATIQRQIKNHDCTVCDATFNRRYILEKHMETAHQRIADTGPKRPRNTMTKLLKQQALIQQSAQSIQSQDSQASVMEMIDVKIAPPPTATPPIVHNSDSTSSTLIGETSYQQGSSNPPPPQPVSLVAKEEVQEPPPAPSLAWQGLYQLANDYPLRMHGVDYMGYLSRQ